MEKDLLGSPTDENLIHMWTLDNFFLKNIKVYKIAGDFILGGNQIQLSKKIGGYFPGNFIYFHIFRKFLYPVSRYVLNFHL